VQLQNRLLRHARSRIADARDFQRLPLHFIRISTAESSRFTLYASKSALSMRLLSTNADGGFSLTSFIANNIPSYAILSHTWGPDDQEVTFQDMCNATGSTKAGYRKIQFCGQQAQKDGLKYFWVDSCCIDKSSSAELQEAVNSMLQWYQKSSVCYVYLQDIPSVCKEPFSTAGNPQAYSRWFFRGWVSHPIQELLTRLLIWSATDFARINCSFGCQILRSKLGVYWGPSLSLPGDFPNYTHRCPTPL
jgi:hypothetical protein